MRGLARLAGAGLGLALLACATPTPPPAPPAPGFLADYARLEARAGFPSQRVWVDPAAPLEGATGLALESVTLQARAGATPVPADEQQTLTDLLYTALYEKLGARFRLAERAAPGVLALRVAVAAEEGANVPLAARTREMPQELPLGLRRPLSPSAAALLAHAVVEAELREPAAGAPLAALVDERRAGADPPPLASWSDVEASCDEWAEALARALVRLGVPLRPDAL